MSASNGAQAICDALLSAGVECVFGLPGTQNVSLFEALRTSRLRTVVATHELSASMMANGYYRASGRLAALVTIPGPGFTWALTGITEATLDSAALVHLVGLPATQPGHAFQLQAIDQTAIATPLVRSVHRIDDASQASRVIARACTDARSGEPGPVLVHISRAALEGGPVSDVDVETPPAARPVDVDAVGATAAMLSSAKRCVLFAGQGCQHVPERIVRLAERLAAPVVTTTSGRGVVAEDHPLSFGFEFAGNGAAVLNELVAASDAVLAIGCKFSHNGSRGFAVRIPQEKLIHVDAAAHVLGANYPARVAVHADAGAFVDALLERLGIAGAPSGFEPDELARLRERARSESVGDLIEPRIHCVVSGKPADFFAALRDAMPRESVLVTDSGMHQMLARAHFRVLCPRGLMVPTNLQSMGFGIGAAIGACIADPARPVVALIGDGGLAMSGLELMTAVRERLRLTVIVFVDGAYGLIRYQQLAVTGRTFATEIAPPDVAALADAVGARHVRLDGNAATVLREAIGSDIVTIVEVVVGDTLPMQVMRAKAIARGVAGPRARSWLKRLRRRR
ncbi:MAG TPA: thiamine pyrophosphate-binding protein [Rhodanobacteraceae bacterium]